MSAVNRNLWTLALASGVSQFGDQFHFLAITSITYSVTGSPLITALQMALNAVPSVIFARWSGALADRYNPRAVIAAISLVQSILTLSYIFTRSVPLIFTLNFLMSTLSVFSLPARAALLPQIAGRDNLLKANARLATIRGGIQLFAPGVAGTVLRLTNPTVAFLFDSFSFVVPALGMLLLKPLETAAEPASKSKVSSPAWTFLKERPDMALLLAAHGAFMLGMWAVNAVFYPFTTEVLKAGPDVLGWSISAYFGANLVSGFLLERWGQQFKRPELLYGGYALGALVWVAYTYVRAVPAILALSFFDGSVYTAAVTLFETRVQEEAPKEAVGRIYAALRGIEQLCSLIGMLLGGAIATYVGVLSGFRWPAVISLSLIFAVMLVARQVRRRQAARIELGYQTDSTT